MANSIDKGQQVLSIDYLEDLSSEKFNRLLKDLVLPGIYSGGLVDIVDANTVRINPLSSFLIAKNNANVGIRVETQASYERDVDSANPYLILTIDWLNQEDNYADFVISSSPPTAPDLLIATLQFSGSTVIGVDYTGSDRISNSADGLILGQGVTANPTGGTAINQAGDNKVTETLQLIVNRLADLASTEDGAVLARHLNSTINASTFKTGTEITQGGVSSAIASTASILTALQTIATQIKTANNIDDDAIKLRHLDFGDGASKLNSITLTLGEAISQSLTLLDDISWTTSTSIKQSLSDLVGRILGINNLISSLTNSVNTNASAIASNEQSIENNDSLPIGTILMFDGQSWKDPDNDPNEPASKSTNNPTMKGWWACTAANFSAHGGIIPNLEDRFIKGVSPGTRGVNHGIMGGSDITLSEANLPSHKHSINHGHSGGNTAAVDLNHQHDMNHAHDISMSENDGTGAITRSRASRVDNEDTTKPTNVFTGKTSLSTGLSHNHSFSVPDHNGDSGLTGSGSPVTNDPKHYKVIYIRKCVQE